MYPEDDQICEFLKNIYRQRFANTNHVSARDVSLGRLADTLNKLLAPYGTYSGSAIQSQRVMKYSPRYRLAFTLLNEDTASGNGALAWDVQKAIQSKTTNLPIARTFARRDVL